MYPYDQNQNQNGSAGWDNDSGTYHYSYRQPAPQQDPILHAQPPKKKRGKGAGKVVALVLCCALVGGGAGVGGAAAYSALTGGSSGSNGETTIYQNVTPTTTVKVSQADGLTEMSLSEIYASYVNSCVCINVTATVQQGFYQYETSGAGSGFIISEDGYIVTNYHVIDGASSIEVTLYNGESYEAKLIGGEEVADVAVLKIDGISGLTPVVLGDSDQLVVGETVSTIGNALGAYSYSQTSGSVSATGRSVTMSDGTVMNMIQTDCTINSGNSGGPLFDQYGRVVGITSAKLSSGSDTSVATIEGMGFAIPLNDVIDIITDYMQYGYVTGRPYMGITVATVESQYQQVFSWPAGVYVNSVEDGSCAQAAGLKVGDIITKVGDTEVTSMAELSSAKNTYKAGETTTLTVYRSGETITLTITFDEQVNNTQTSTSDSSTSNGDSSTQDPNAQETASNGNNYGNGNSNGGYGYGGSNGGYGSFPFGG
jgi:serine protease Do